MSMYQYYIIEIQEYEDGTYGDLMHFAYDEDEQKALLKGESKYHAVLSEAAVSELPRHGAVMLSSKCEPLAAECYDKTNSDHRVTELYSNQYYVVEIQQYANGEYGHIIHYAYDANGYEAYLKGESAYYSVLSAAATSKLLQHGAFLMTSTCKPIDYKCYERAPEELAEELAEESTTESA